jgi:hypothetical protein
VSVVRFHLWPPLFQRLDIVGPFSFPVINNY